MLIGICDNQKADMERVRTFIKHYSQNEYEFEIKTFISGQSLLESKKEFDIVFLAIELEGEDGIDIAAQINACQPSTIIILMTAFAQYVTRSFHVKTFQLLLKPLEETLFHEEFARCLAQYEKQQDSFAVSHRGQTIYLRKSEIVYMETNKRVITAYLINNQTRSYYGKIATEEERLKDDHFIRCHKSYLVNMAYVRSFNHNSIITALENDNGMVKLPLSKQRYEAVNTAMQRYLMETCGK